jgi:hypothetical protein
MGARSQGLQLMISTADPNQIAKTATLDDLRRHAALALERTPTGAA